MKIQVLCGMIASGKSIYCKNAAKQGIICLNDDSIVNMLHGNDYTLYDKSLKILYKSIENHVIGTSLAMNRIVLVDRGLNLSLRGRKRWLALGKSFDVPVEAIIFKNEGPEIHAKRRTKSDPRGHDFNYWKKVANTHHSEYTEPSMMEGFDAIHHISFEEIQSGKIFKE
jgi:hypothetical protein